LKGKGGREGRGRRSYRGRRSNEMGLNCWRWRI